MYSDTIELIRAAHRRRCFAMEQRKRSDLALGAFVRMTLGWSKNSTPEERARIRARAAEVVEIGEAVAKEAVKAKKQADRLGVALEQLNREPVAGVDDEDYRSVADMIAASIRTRVPWDEIEAACDRELTRLAKLLPAWRWCETVNGFGAMSLAMIVGEAGDLSNYPTVAKLWKRMGLAVIDGVRQGGLPKGAPAEKWIAHGYNKQRRSRVWNFGKAMCKVNFDLVGEARVAGHYRTLYLQRKEYERAMAVAKGLKIAPSSAIPKKRRAEFMSLGQIDDRGRRYMEKRLLRDLWRAWRAASARMNPEAAVPPADHSDAGLEPAGEGRLRDGNRYAIALPEPVAAE